ncbi:MAG: glycerophosphodiester phosphodiesterase family protein [Clostridia bacterium]|nr:glycerophosphodiester phosphodiesterase family protein [Clostridia bacterium]
MIRHEPGKIYVVAHRGVSGANIPCNTKAAFSIALSQGADILELDVTKSKDGQLFVFHPGMEKAHLNLDCSLSELTSDEIDKLRFVNQDNVITSYKITPLVEMLEFLKGKAYINIDKYWENFEEITYAIRRTGVEKQAIVKIPGETKYVDLVEKIAPDLALIPMLRSKDRLTEYALEKNVNYIGVEALFETDNDEIVSDNYIEKMHKRGLMLYGNPIVYSETANISAGHTDDCALTRDIDKGWGWFVDKKFDIIQTDWCLMLKNYLKGRGY